MTLKKIALVSAIAALGVAQGVSAHTGIRDSKLLEGQGNVPAFDATLSKVINGATEYNAFTITHGCASNLVPETPVGTVAAPSTRKDVIAMAALFPNSPNAADVKIYRFKTGSIVSNVVGVDGTVLTGQPTTLTPPTDLSGDIAGASTTGGLTNLGLGLVSPNLFGDLIIPKFDAAGNARGYAVFNGPVSRAGYNYLSAPLSESSMPAVAGASSFSTTGLSPFKFTVPKFNPASCAKNLIVRVAISNWCSRGEATKTAADRKDVWIGTDTGSVMYSMTGANAEIMPNSQATMGMGGSTGVALSEQGNGKSFWPAITVMRDLTTNPLPASCNGESYDVVVEPSGSDIDTNLTINQGAYPNGAPGPKFY
jgi:hypothetical protein